MFIRLAAFTLALPLAAHAVVFSGEVESAGAQTIFTPPSNSSPVVLRYYVADGTRVKKGDVVLRIDAGESAGQIRTLDAQIAQGVAKADKEVAELRLKSADAELAYIDAQAAFDTAKVDAAIPRNLLSALDFDRYKAELERSDHDATLKHQEFEAAQAAVERRSKDGALELDKLKTQRSYHQAQVDYAEVHAERDGIVIHAFGVAFMNAGGRLEEGSSSYPGQKVGEVTGDGAMRVRAWVLASDRKALQANGKLRLGFDALPGVPANGTITAISGAPEQRNAWGEGRYFVVDVDIDDAAKLALKPGMSVRLETPEADQHAPALSATNAKPSDPVRANGEIYARTSAAIMPPQVEDLWQMNITQMITDGQPVKQGETVVTFDGGDLLKNLTAKQSELEEKLRTQEKARLELADRARDEAVTTAQAHAETIKAQRKASQPEIVLPAVEYKKLVIARRKAELKEKASEQRERVAAEERSAEQRMADADVARLKTDVDRLKIGVGALEVKAPRDGIVVHATGWDNEKFDVGKQIWRGQSVGEIPDLSTLAVRASLAERDLVRVRNGDRVRVIVEGGSGQSLGGRIEEIGTSVHSKSRVEPVPVIDLRIVLDPTQVALKTGQPVRVEIEEKKGT